MLIALTLFIGLSGISARNNSEESKVVSEFDLSDAAGKRHTTKEWEGSKAIVLIFISAECPASNGYAPELNHLYKEFLNHGVKFYGVHSDPDLTAGQALAHAEEYQLPFPILLDPKQTLARQSVAKRVPTAIILSPEGNVLYRGRIDDRYLSVGKKRTEPTRRDVQETLALIVVGKTTTFAETEVFGCLLPKLTPRTEPKPR